MFFEVLDVTYHTAITIDSRGQPISSGARTTTSPLISRGACSLSAQGPYRINRGGAQRWDEAGNRSCGHQHGNGDSHDRHTHAGDLIKLRLHVPHAEDCHRHADSEA